MEKDLDSRLYEEYKNGNKEAFEMLYSKYKSKIEYFIFNIVKDYQKAEDITQEVFIYILQNNNLEKGNFKYYIYLVAKCRAINYINVEKRRKEITEKYVFNEEEKIEKDVLEKTCNIETKKEILEAINLLDDKYKNPIYLSNVEGFSYKEISEILNKPLSTVKSLIFRGRKNLRSILIKKGVVEMSKIAKVSIIIICILVLGAGIGYAVTKIVNEKERKEREEHIASLTPSFESTIDENTINNLWVGTLDLAWKELKERTGLNSIDLEEGNLPVVDALNNSKFSKKDLDSNDYNIKVERTGNGGYIIDTTLQKELNFLEVFDNFSLDYDFKFGDSSEPLKFFGVNNATSEEVNKNVEILFYNRESDTSSFSNDFAVKLKTKEGDEIILYRTNDNKSFEEYYKDLQSKTETYTGSREFGEDDELRVPYVKTVGRIAYNELFCKTIKGTNGMYFEDIIQNVNFNLNEKGCNLGSDVTLVTECLGIGMDTKYCYFQDKFVIFMKEKDVNNPYFALKVDNTDLLVKKDEISEPIIYDYTTIEGPRKVELQIGENTFFEDENYEYYFDTKKSSYVYVYFPDGTHQKIEWALKDGKIGIDLLDKYGIEYIKKDKN